MENSQTDKIKEKSTSSVYDERSLFEGSETFVHPTALVGPHVRLGLGVKIGPYVVITGSVFIGSKTRIYSYVSIGAPAQNIGTQKSLGTITIGERNEIREYASIHASKYEDGLTVIGNDCYIMAYCHIAHDVRLGNNVTLINNVNLGGHTIVEDRAILMANAATHQFCRVGAYAALAPFSGIRQDIPPYGLYNGQPAVFSGLNRVGLIRGGLPIESRERIKLITQLFFHQALSLDDLSAYVYNDAVLHGDEYIMRFLAFVAHSIGQGRGISRRRM